MDWLATDIKVPNGTNIATALNKKTLPRVSKEGKNIRSLKLD